MADFDESDRNGDDEPFFNEDGADEGFAEYMRELEAEAFILHTPGPDGKKLGDRLREMLEEAYGSDEVDEIQNDMLDECLQHLAGSLTKRTEKHVSQLFNEVAELEPSDRDFVVIEATSGRDFDPRFITKIGINKDFTDYTESEIRQMEGFLLLHEAARALGVGIDLRGLTSEERSHPALIIDPLSSYEDYAAESTYGYPDLPPPPWEAPKPPLMLPSGPPVPKPPRKFNIG
jgi:hypothetical protein